MNNNMADRANGRSSIQIERPSLRVFSQEDIDAGRTDYHETQAMEVRQ